MRNIELYKPDFDKKEIKSVSKILNSGWITNGLITKKFEKKIQIKLKVKNAIAVNSCTSGINVVLSCFNLKKGDEVITTLVTFISTIHTLFYLGLKIKFIDIDKKNLSMDLNQLKKNISKKTKLVLVNHYGGIPSNIEEIISICKKNNIYLLEDAATAFGAKFNNKFIGSFNYSTSIFSFQANKIITTGEGGVITTNNDTLAKEIRKKIFNGFFNNDIVCHGFKYNFTDIQASLGLIQLSKLNKFIRYRTKLRLLYDQELKILEKKNLISLYKKDKNIHCSEYIYTIVINDKYGFKRQKLINFLKKNYIQTRIHYTTANMTKFYKKKISYKNINNSIYVSKNILSLPFHNSLKKKDIKRICGCIKKFFGIL